METLNNEELLEINGGDFKGDIRGYIIGKIIDAAIPIIKDAAYTPMESHAQNSAYVRGHGGPL